jgi:HPt (histidine-containing phosphotransfer) domain-containing protein
MEPVLSSYAADPDMVEIVREFALELPGRADRIEQLLAAGGLEELRVMAHQLKGAGGGYGYAPVTELAGALERAIHDARAHGEIESRAAELCKVLRAVVAPEPA